MDIEGSLGAMAIDIIERRRQKSKQRSGGEAEWVLTVGRNDGLIEDAKPMLSPHDLLQPAARRQKPGTSLEFACPWESLMVIDTVGSQILARLFESGQDWDMST